MSRLLRLRVGQASDPGKVRTHNEDSLLVDADGGVVVVADGMGGHKAGDVASKLAVAAVREAFSGGDDEPQPSRWLLFRRKLTGKDRLVEAIQRANRVVLETARRKPECSGMGTTVVALVMDDGALYYAHVGDSRLYRLRDGALVQLTEDHSLLNEYLKLGVIKPDMAQRFPYKNIIVRALGLSPGVEVDADVDRPQVGDRYLLCSDGLTDMAEEEEVRGVLARGGDPETAAAALIELALEGGGLDNITAVVVDVVAEVS
ncbi:MAG: Stp1/IreP family PP2C-type Ser/Thr phosphatase [bacterium]|nr:Stp1/IreP family PP2C-type Ser/Thr phosphatase [Myxococcales bacterium]MCB9550922.1 Stp1/IreP family PP2C-type Ser/Thr phosphatase [Myxococcales bacterium]